MFKWNCNIEEKPIVSALMVAVIVGLICLIIYVIKFYEPIREVPPTLKLETYDGQTLELEPISYSWFYKRQEYVKESDFDPNNYNYSNCTIYNSMNSYNFPTLKAVPKTQFKKMFKTTYMFNPDTGKYEQYEDDGNTFESYSQDVFLKSYTERSHTYVSVYTMTYKQGRVSYVFKVVDQDDFGFGMIKEYKGTTLEQKDKIQEIIEKVSKTEFLENIEIQDGKIELTYKYRIANANVTSISLALFSIIDDLSEIDFIHQNTAFMQPVEENEQIVQKEIEYTEPRIITRESMMQEYNFSFDEIKEKIGL